MAAARFVRTIICMTAVLAAALGSAGGAAAAPPARDDVASHWTSERRAQAQPRDLVLDHRGLGYLRRADGSLRPHGHAIPPAARGSPVRSTPIPSAKPEGNPGGGGSNDTTAPEIGDRSPGQGATVGADHRFSAVVTDAESGVKSVSFVIVTPSGGTQSFSGSFVGDDTWAVNLTGFSDGDWSWYVTAKDSAKKGGNTATSDTWGFTVSTSGTDPDPGPDPDVVTNDPWSFGGDAQTAVGRVYFEMPANRAKSKWNGYVCSGTVAIDDTTGRSVIITAAHCVYDDAYKEFARNVLFIPNQAETNGTGTDRNCANDPLGCWTASHGVVEAAWANQTWPANIPWDYAYYVVSDSGAHSTGLDGQSYSALDEAADSLPVQFTAPTVGARTHALGYSYSEDPKLMYCAEDLAAESSYDDWWLGSCELSGGASGGPWVQPMDTATGSGSIVSVNSWGYSNQPGMAGPRLDGGASSLFDLAKTAEGNTIR